MEALVALLIAVITIAAILLPDRRDGRHRAGVTVADIMARLATDDRRTYLPLRGW